MIRRSLRPSPSWTVSAPSRRLPDLVIRRRPTRFWPRSPPITNANKSRPRHAEPRGSADLEPVATAHRRARRAAATGADDPERARRIPRRLLAGAAALAILIAIPVIAIVGPSRPIRPGVSARLDVGSIASRILTAAKRTSPEPTNRERPNPRTTRHQKAKAAIKHHAASAPRRRRLFRVGRLRDRRAALPWLPTYRRPK
jgi:hypothetical protein